MKFYIIIFIIFVYVAVSFFRFRYILNHANLPDIVQKDETFGSGAKLVYVAAGDSTSVGVGASEVGKTYPYQLAKFLSANYAVEYHNVGVSGATTGDVIKNQLDKIIELHPDIVTISIGANDVTHLHSLTSILENDNKILSELLQKTNAKIYITNVPRFDQAYLLPWPLRALYNFHAKSINKKLKSPDSNRVIYIDIHSVGVVNSADQFHPSDAGYKLWFEAFSSKLKL